MRTRGSKGREGPVEYYDRRGVLGAPVEESVAFAPNEELREQILQGRGTRRL